MIKLIYIFRIIPDTRIFEDFSDDFYTFNDMEGKLFRIMENMKN